MNRTSCISEPIAVQHLPPGVRAIESADCLLCVGVRFADTATGLFSHRLRSEALIIRAFDVTFGTTHVPGVAGSEVLSALVAAVRIKPRRILPPRLQPPSCATISPLPRFATADLPRQRTLI